MINYENANISLRFCEESSSRPGQNDVSLSIDGSGNLEHFVRAFKAFLTAVGFVDESISDVLREPENAFEKHYGLTPEGEAWLDRVKERNDPPSEGWRKPVGWPFAGPDQGDDTPPGPTFEADVAPMADLPPPYKGVHFDPAQEDK